MVRAEAPEGLRLLTRLRVTWLDVFTSTPLAGNGLAVVHGADGLDDDFMLRFARETRLSEVTFVQAPTAEGVDYRNRIFTGMSEIPFAGHPSLGTAVAVARERGEDHVRYLQETQAGVQPVDVALDGDRARASMLQEPAVFGDEVDPAEALAAIGLAPSDAHPDLPAQTVSCGILQLILPVRGAEALARAKPDAGLLRDVTARTGTLVIYAAAINTVRGTAVARGFFEEPGGAVEDPATGSAAGPLCAYLHRHAGLDALVIHQGGAIGRPSRLDTALEGDRVRVSGDCVVVLEGELLA